MGIGRSTTRRTGLVYWILAYRAWILESSKGLANGSGRICNCFYCLLALPFPLSPFFDSPVSSPRGTLYALYDATTRHFDEGIYYLLDFRELRRKCTILRPLEGYLLPCHLHFCKSFAAQKSIRRPQSQEERTLLEERRYSLLAKRPGYRGITGPRMECPPARGWAS